MATVADGNARNARAGESPLRTCVVSRRQDTPANLLRFVVAPDGTIVPDIDCRLPGRGVWTCLDRKTVETAVRTRAFNKGMKRETQIATDLPDLVERLLLQRALTSLSMCNKAGLALAGFTKVENAIAEGSLGVLLHGEGGSADGIDKLDRRFNAMCRDLGRVPRIIRSFTIEQMSLALGRSNVVHAALKMGGAAQHFLTQVERLDRYRTGTAYGD